MRHIMIAQRNALPIHDIFPRLRDPHRFLCDILILQLARLTAA